MREKSSQNAKKRKGERSSRGAHKPNFGTQKSKKLGGIENRVIAKKGTKKKEGGLGH